MSARDYSKSYEQILMKFFGGVGLGPRNDWCDFGGYGDRDPYPGII